MDQHICRAKRQDNGEWVYGYYVRKHDSLIPGITSHFILRQDPGESLVSWLPVKSDTLCRCTGVKDKTGAVIFENDIVKMRNFGEDIYSRSVEVIGNIFDSTELMEQL